jgi:hypothetical protein
MTRSKKHCESRLDFPGYTGEETLEPISLEELDQEAQEQQPGATPG